MHTDQVHRNTMDAVITAVSAIDQLSARERQILAMAALGLTDKEIAAKSGVSLTTVRTYWERLRQKTGAVNRASAVAMFVRGTAQGVPDLPEQPTEPSTLLQATVDAALGGILVLDSSATIVSANEKICAMLQVPAASLEGSSINELIGPRFEAFHHALIAAKDEEFQAVLTVSAFVKTRVGQDLLASITIRTIDTPNGRYTVLFIQDLLAELDARRRGLHTSAVLRSS
jgi:PAS domain S-box-containing protein